MDHLRLVDCRSVVLNDMGNVNNVDVNRSVHLAAANDPLTYCPTRPLTCMRQFCRHRWSLRGERLRYSKAKPNPTEQWQIVTVVPVIGNSLL